jgi:putative membrane protein
MKTRTILSTAAALSLMAGTALADTSAQDFVNKAATSSLFEIESSKIALEKSQNPQVKAFAEQMIKDHEANSAKLQATIAESGASVTAPKTLDEAHQEKLDTLRETDADNFDDEYTQIQVDAHEDAVELFSDYSEDGDNEALKGFATSSLATLKQHHEKAEALDEMF